MRIYCQQLILVLLIIACCSCGGGNKHNGNPNPSLDELNPEAQPGRMTAAMDVLPGGLFDSLDPGSLRLDWSIQDGVSIARISTTATENLRAAYLRIPLPDGLNSGASITPGPWAGEDALSIAVPSSDDTLDIGICMLHPDKADGFTGSGVLATVKFDGSPLALQRSSSAAPVSPASRIDLDYDPYRNHFYWYYRNQGDYDQNGIVNVSDLTPIAVHFGKSSTGGFPLASTESVVDGDGNGLISIADISPIGIGFGSRVDSFNIYQGVQSDYPASPTAASTIDALQTVALGDSLNAASAGRLYYEIHSDASSDPAPAYWLRPLDGSTEGIPSEIAGLGNQPPIAEFTIEKSIGVEPFQLKADASASSDPEGGELEYFWFVVDGLFSSELTSPGDVTLPQSVDSGNWSVALYVRDEDGATGFLSKQFSVAASPGWETIELDVAAPGKPINRIEDIALAGIDGRPYIAAVYQSTSETVVSLNYGNDPLWNQLLDFRRINEMMGGNDGQVEILDVNGVPGVLSLQKKPTESRVEYNYVEDQVFTTPYNIALSTSNLRDISAVMVEDRPSVVIFDRSNGDLLQATSDDANGEHWDSASVFISGNNTGWGVQAGLIDSSPAVFYYDGDTGEMRFADSHIDTGNVVWHVDFPVYNGNFSDLGDAVLDIPDGGQWLLMHDHSGNGLVSMRDSGFSTQEQIAPTAGDSHSEYSAAVINGRVCVAYVDNGMLKFIRSTSGNAASWLPVQDITSLTVEDGWVSLADVAGFPAVAFVESTTNTAHYSVLVE